MQYSRVLARWLKTSGLTPVEAAPKLGVSFQTVYRWLEGDCVPPRSRLPHLARALGVGAARLARIVEAERKHRPHRDAADTTATVDETPAQPVSP